MQTQEYPVLKKLIDAEKHGSVHTVQTLADTEPAFNEGGIRWTIFQHKDKLLEEGAIFYNGRKLLIDRDRYIACVRSGL
jgi:deoxyribodipyrimidine photolyase